MCKHRIKKDIADTASPGRIPTYHVQNIISQTNAIPQETSEIMY